MSEPVQLSVVVPVFNGSEQVEDAVRTLVEGLSSGPSYEVIFVDDGSTDGCAERLHELVASWPQITVAAHAPNRGKGYAVRSGMARAQGAVRVFTDVDVPYGCEAILRVAGIVERGEADVVVGDRTLDGSSYHEHVGPLRDVASRGFSLLVGLLAPGALADTQCGLKGFHGEVAAHLFPLLREDGFALDAELLYVCRKHNLSVRPVAVRLQRHGQSTVSVFREVLPMLLSICALRPRWRFGHYRDPWFAERGAQGRSEPVVQATGAGT